MSLFGKIFSGGADREVKKLQPLVDRIVALRPQMMEMSAEQMRARRRSLKTVFRMAKR